MRVFKNPHIIAAIFYLVTVLFVFWPILWPSQGTLVFGDDIHRSYHFFRQLFADAISRGEFPWWNPYLFSGEPFIANPSLAFWYPVNWLFILIPYRFVYSWIIPLHIFWAMMGMYCALRAMLNAKCRAVAKAAMARRRQMPNEKQAFIIHHSSFSITLSAWLSGLMFGLSGFFMGRVWEGHIELILSASWMPWVIAAFGAISNISREAGSRFAGQFPISNEEAKNHTYKLRRAIVLAGVALAMQILAGYQTMALLTLEAVFIITLFQSVAVKSFQPLLRTGLAGLAGLALSAIQIFPGQEFFRASIRTYALPYTWAVFGSYTIGNLKQLLDPFIFGFPWSYKGPSPNFGEMAAYIGKGGLLLSVLAVIMLNFHLIRKALSRIMNYELRNTNNEIGFMNKQLMVFVLSMVGIALFGLWVSFGWNAPLDLNKILWDIVPMYKYLRIPSRHLILFVFGMTALAGLGFYQIMRIISFARPGLAKLAVLTISLFITVDMLWFARMFVVLRSDPATRHNIDLVGYLQKNLGLARVIPNFNVGMGTRDALDFDAAMGYRFMSASGYDPAILHNYYEFAAAVAGIENPDVQQTDVQIPYLLPASRYMDFLNVKYIFVPSWFDSVAGSHLKYKLVMEENKKDYFRLYENAHVLPRFFLVPTLVVLPNRDAIARAIRMGEHDPGMVVLAQRKDFSPSFTMDCGIKKLPAVTVVSYSMNKIILNTDAPCNAFLSTSEVMYPGWQATIDGKESNLIEGNLAFRTLPVPAGNHRIEMAYRPKIFFVSIALSMTTVLFCLLWTRRIVQL